jgi:diaminohydroxyphosphoribosylaminopyrimidine deaminase/5-amino-6-(5-phosphoribosylamino)uracil reductase
VTTPSTSGDDLARLRRALALAPRGRFAVEPNPTVGCVVAKDDRVLAEACHEAYGGPHAEVTALRAAGPAARGATVFVSLSPCARGGKKTPPCVDALVAAGVSRVVFASRDPHPGETGESDARLRAAGIEVHGPVLEAEGEPLLAVHRAWLGATTPWVVLKWAMSIDGRIAPAAHRGGILSGARALGVAHALRGTADAVLVGVGTVLADDPRLTCRLEGGPPHGRPQPLRVVVDSALRTPPRARVIEDPGGATHVFCARAEPALRRALEGRGVTVHETPGAEGRVDLARALASLFALGVRRLLVEGGARLHGALLRAGLAHQVSAFVTPRVLGADGAPTPTAGTGFDDLGRAPRLSDVAWRGLGDDVWIQGYVPTGRSGGRS